MFLTLLEASQSRKILKNIYCNNEREPRGGERTTAFKKRETDSQNVQGQKTNKETNTNQPINKQNLSLFLRLNCFPTVTISNSQKTLVF